MNTIATLSGQDVFHDAGRFDTGEALIETLELEREALVFETQQMQDRGVQVADVDAIFDDVET